MSSAEIEKIARGNVRGARRGGEIAPEIISWHVVCLLSVRAAVVFAERFVFVASGV